MELRRFIWRRDRTILAAALGFGGALGAMLCAMVAGRADRAGGERASGAQPLLTSLSGAGRAEHAEASVRPETGVMPPMPWGTELVLRSVAGGRELRAFAPRPGNRLSIARWQQDLQIAGWIPVDGTHGVATDLMLYRHGNRTCGLMVYEDDEFQQLALIWVDGATLE